MFNTFSLFFLFPLPNFNLLFLIFPPVNYSNLWEKFFSAKNGIPDSPPTSSPPISPLMTTYSPSLPLFLFSSFSLFLSCLYVVLCLPVFSLFHLHFLFLGKCNSLSLIHVISLQHFYPVWFTYFSYFLFFLCFWSPHLFLFLFLSLSLFFLSFWSPSFFSPLALCMPIFDKT